MAQKMTGALVFDERTDRYDIRFDLNSYMDADMRELAKRTLSKVDALTEAEFAELPIYAADEV